MKSAFRDRPEIRPTAPDARRSTAPMPRRSGLGSPVSARKSDPTIIFDTSIWDDMGVDRRPNRRDVIGILGGVALAPLVAIGGGARKDRRVIEEELIERRFTLPGTDEGSSEKRIVHQIGWGETEVIRFDLAVTATDDVLVEIFPNERQYERSRRGGEGIRLDSFSTDSYTAGYVFRRGEMASAGVDGSDLDGLYITVENRNRASVDVNADVQYVREGAELEDAHFDVEIVDTNVPADGAGTVAVRTAVTNAGEGADTQELRLEIGDETFDRASVELGGGESETVILSADIDDSLDFAGETELRVRGEGSTAVERIEFESGSGREAIASSDDPAAESDDDVQRGFFSNDAGTDFDPVGGQMNLSVAGFLLSIAGIFISLARGD